MGLIKTNYPIDLTYLDKGNSSYSSHTIDWTANPAQSLMLTDTCRLTFTAPRYNRILVLRLVQDGTGGHSVQFPALVKWAGGVRPNISTAANAVDIITFHWDGTNYLASVSLDLLTAAIDLSGDCIFWVPFGEPSGVSAVELISANNGTLTNSGGSGTPVFAAGKMDNAVDIENSGAENQYVDFGDILPFSSMSITDFSVSAWCKAETWGADRLIVCKDTVFFLQYYHNVGGLDNFRFRVKADGSWTDEEAIYGQLDPPATATWYHLVGVWTDNSSNKIYVNGVIGDTVGGAENGDQTDAGEIYVGGWPGTGRYFDGLVDNVMIFDKALSAEEVGFLYNGGNGIEALR